MDAMILDDVEEMSYRVAVRLFRRCAYPMSGFVGVGNRVEEDDGVVSRVWFSQ